MIKYGFIVLLLGVSSAVARAQQAPTVPSPPVRIGPLRLEKISFSRVYGHCGGGPCVTARIDYLRVVSAESAQAPAKLTAALADWVLRLENGKVAKNAQEVLNQFVDRNCESRQEESKTNMDEAFSPLWYESTTLKIEYQSAQVLSLSSLSYGYYGGAHGEGGLTYANFRAPTDERIRLADISKEGFAAPLNAAGERRLRELFGLSPEESLKEANFTFTDDHFQLNENFSIGADGLTFYFQSHEIAPGNGAIKLFLPYADFRKLLRPDAVTFRTQPDGHTAAKS